MNSYRRLFLLVILSLLSDCFSFSLAFHRRSLLISSSSSSRSSSSRHGNSGSKGILGMSSFLDDSEWTPEKEYRCLWRLRRKLSRILITPVLKSNLKEEEERRGDDDKEVVENEEGLDTATLFSIGLVAISIAIFRFGGRAAFVSFLGLDFIADAGLKENLDSFLSYFQGLGAVTDYLLFLSAWIVVKTFCIDALTILLAVSSGILFGGLWQGTLASVASSTIASSLNFLAVRQFFGEQMQEYIQSRASLRSLDRACAKDGFKTVLTLRLSPLIPIPIAAYSYLYGGTSIAYPEFAAGLSLGSIKPYLFDCYLGIFGQSVINNENNDGDPLIIAAVIAILAIGILSTQLASNFYNELMLNEGDLEEEKDDGTIANDIYNVFAGVFGFEDRDILPDNEDGNLLNSLRLDLKDAYERVNTVVDNEIEVVEQEIKMEREIPLNEVDWDGKLLRVGPLAPEITYKEGNDDQGDRAVYAYPGDRELATYEDGSRDDDAMFVYLFESLLFSFILLSKVGGRIIIQK